MKLLIYCSKAKPYLYFENDFGEDEYGMIYDPQWLLTTDSCFNKDYAVNGKIVAECDFEVEEIEFKHIHERDDLGRLHNESWWEYQGLNISNYKCELAEKSCLDSDKIIDYLGNNKGYAIHIKNLHIFDEPKELSDYYSIHNIGGMLLTDKLKKASQNMQRVSTQDWEYGTANPNDIVILISIHSEELCKILNRKQTIILKNKVLKRMLGNDK